MPAPRRRRIDEIGDESRRRILDSAEELFAEKGFERTSFVDVATRSGISRGSIPWHFKSKDGLLLAVVERAIERDLPAAQFAPDRAGAREILSQYAAFLRNGNPELFYMLQTEAISSDGLVHEQYVEFFRSRRVPFAAWYAESQPMATAEVLKHAANLSTVINGALTGIQLQWQLDPTEIDLEGSLDALADMIVAFLAAPRAARSAAPSSIRRKRATG